MSCYSVKPIRSEKANSFSVWPCVHTKGPVKSKSILIVKTADNLCANWGAQRKMWYLDSELFMRVFWTIIYQTNLSVVSHSLLKTMWARTLSGPWHLSSLRDRDVILGYWTLCPPFSLSSVPPTNLKLKSQIVNCWLFVLKVHYILQKRKANSEGFYLQD